MTDQKSHADTQLIGSGRQPRYTQGVVNPVVQRASSVTFPSLAALRHAEAHCAEEVLYYGRRGTLTHFALRDAMTELENGAGCVLFPCGTAAATQAIAAFVSSGDHVLIAGTVYGPISAFCQRTLARMQVSVDWFDPRIAAGIADLIQPTTRVIFLESPGSITMEVMDIPAIVAAVRRCAPEIVIIIDNTWAAGVLLPALDLGVDISVQSGSKYLIGHSDAMLGTAVANARCLETLRENAYLMGQMVDADTAYLASRGLRTLPLRLRQHAQSSLHIAQWLTQQPAVLRVNHPALPGNPDYALWQRDFNGSNGLFSFVLRQRLDETQLATFLDGFQHFSMAFSWGGFESLIMAYQPETLHSAWAQRPDYGGTVIRLHIGLEDCADLIDDLQRGLQRLAACSDSRPAAEPNPALQA